MIDWLVDFKTKNTSFLSIFCEHIFCFIYSFFLFQMNYFTFISPLRRPNFFSLQGFSPNPHVRQSENPHSYTVSVVCEFILQKHLIYIFPMPKIKTDNPILSREELILFFCIFFWRLCCIPVVSSYLYKGFSLLFIAASPDKSFFQTYYFNYFNLINLLLCWEM